MNTAVAVTAAPVATLPPRVALAAVGQSSFAARSSVSVVADGGTDGAGPGSVQADRGATGTGSTTSSNVLGSNVLGSNALGSNALGASAAKTGSERAGGDANAGTSGVIITVNPTFAYDPQAQRVVMLTRDRKTGAVETQVPSEVALRQYEQAVKRVREDVAVAQQSGAAPAQDSTLTAASLGVVIPKAGSSTVGATSGRGGGARYNVVV